MKFVNKVLAALLILAIGYLAYGLLEIRKDLFTVYNVEDKYAYDPGDTDLIIVDFNRYGCDHCRILHPVLMEAIKRDGKIRYVSRTVAYGNEWESTLVASVYAAAEQGKFIEMHDMISANWPLDGRKNLFKYAKQIGLDTKLLSRDMSKEHVLNQVTINQDYFEAWRLGRTPTLLIGDSFIYAPKEKNLSVDDLLKKFETARK